MSQQRDYEAELRLAMGEGLLTRDEADGLREEARRLGRSPLELLRERGRLSEETLSSRMEKPRELPEPPGAGKDMPPPAPAPADVTQTMAPGVPLRPGMEPSPGTPAPAFPIPGWDRYQPVGFLGQGGMGRVFTAYDPRLCAARWPSSSSVFVLPQGGAWTCPPSSRRTTSASAAQLALVN